MIKIVAFFAFGILPTQILAFECTKYQHEEKFKIICQLESSAQKLEFIAGHKACEFPQGNKSSCAYIIACDKNKTRRSPVVFRAGSSISDYCLSKNININTKTLIDYNGMKASLKCPIKKSMDISLEIGAKTHACKFKFSDLDI